MMQAAEREELIELVREHALRLGDFVLASGQRAHFYLDCRQITLHPRALNLIATGLLELLPNPAVDAVGGMAIGADPITAGLVMLAGQRQLPLLGFMVRKQAKEHGLGRQVEGPVKPGMSVVVVEDVVTSGGSMIAAIEAAQAFGLRVVGALAVVDRLAGGRQAIERLGIPLSVLLTLDDLQIPPPPNS